MDKKKVIGSLNEALHYLNTTPIDLKTMVLYKDMAFRHIEDTLSELKKSDWISVEDELPPYEEDVLVTTKIDPSIVWITMRVKKHLYLDKNSFVNDRTFYEITHWRRIDKLEV